MLDGDIKACFDSISHSALMDRVRRRVKDKRVLALVKAFLKAGILTELGENQDTHTGTPQGGILSPLLANIALSELDEHLHGPWKPGGSMSTESRRARRRVKGLPTWRLIRYADDFVVLVNGGQADTEAIRDEVADVLAPIGLRRSPAKTRSMHVSEGFEFLGFRIQWKRKKGEQALRLHLHRQTSNPDSEGQDSCFDPQDVTTRSGFRADRTEHGDAQVGQLLQTRCREERLRHAGQLRLAASNPHADTATPLEMEGRRRRFTTPTGRWLPITAGEIELKRIAAIPITRYRCRGSKIPNPWIRPHHA